MNTARIPGIHFSAVASYPLVAAAVAAAGGASDVHVAPVVSRDHFYGNPPEQVQALADYGTLCVEMEAAGLYGVAAEPGPAGAGRPDHLRPPARRRGGHDRRGAGAELQPGPGPRRRRRPLLTPPHPLHPRVCVAHWVPRAPGVTEVTMRTDEFDMLPMLSRGKHRNPARARASWSLASFLAGERWSDRPRCTHPLLAHLARLVNDCRLRRGPAAPGAADPLGHRSHQRRPAVEPRDRLPGRPAGAAGRGRGDPAGAVRRAAQPGPHARPG